MKLFDFALWQDVRFGARMLKKQPGFTFVAVFTLALGIGATSSMFSLAHGALLTPPPYPQPEHIVLVRPAKKEGGPVGSGCSTAQWLEWRKGTKSFEAIAVYNWT